MTREVSQFVVVAHEFEPVVAKLVQRGGAALRRAAKLPLGDRTEMARYDEICCAIEQCAIASVWRAEPILRVIPSADAPRETTVLLPDSSPRQWLPEEVRGWLSQGRTVIELRLPHDTGPTEIGGSPDTGPPPPARRWHSRARYADQAMRQRFLDLLECAVMAPGTAEGIIRPSRITNSVLTEALRSYSAVQSGQSPVSAPVAWEDGSFGPEFPLRGIEMSQALPSGWRVLRFTLLSIRHVTMDPIVDGAWLRNARVSLPRQKGQTDQLVFEASLLQLAALAHQAPTLIYMHQTGLETAIVGFYRAVVHQLRAEPGRIAVVPCYFRGGDNFAEGTPWTNH